MKNAYNFVINQLRVDPEDSDVLFCKGDSLKKLGRDEEAQQCFRKAKVLEK